MKQHPRILLPTIISLLCLIGASWGATEAEILIKLKNSMSSVISLNDWDESVSPFNGNSSNWTGLCCTQKGSVLGLRPENMGLMGQIDIDQLMNLPDLRTLSFMNNSFKGSMPNLKMLSSLRVLYLSYNQFSCEIPGDAFSGRKASQRVYLQRNQFTGQIPKSLAELHRLGWSNLEGNQFEGKIPTFGRRISPWLILQTTNFKVEFRTP
ncbi:hypothetical protein SLE2022_184330 [Rubroshorea leprosula]